MQVLEISRRLWRPGYFAIAVAFLIAVGSLMPAEDAGSLPGSDLAHHVFAYFLLSLFAVLAVTGRLNTGVALMGAMALGVSLELIQPLVGRVSDFHDVMANAAGVVAGLAAATGFRHVQQRLSHRQWSHGWD